jgi:hypothetical protein
MNVCWNVTDRAPLVVEKNTRNILGKFGLGERSDNGNLLIESALLNRLCVTNTGFQHPRKRILTWYSLEDKAKCSKEWISDHTVWLSDQAKEVRN